MLGLIYTIGIYLGFVIGLAVLTAVFALPSIIVRTVKKKSAKELSESVSKWLSISYAALIVASLVVSLLDILPAVTIQLNQAFSDKKAVMECGWFAILFVVISLAYIGNIFVLTTNCFQDDTTVAKKMQRVGFAVGAVVIISLLISVLDYYATSMCWNIFVVSFGALLGGVKVGFGAYENLGKTKLTLLKFGVIILCFAVYGLITFVLINTLYTKFNEVFGLILSIFQLVGVIWLARYLCNKCDDLKKKLKVIEY